MKKNENKQKKILDLWQKPDEQAEAGEPIGCLCSSFTFHPDLFEEECLSRFLGLNEDSKEEPELYAIQLDYKLSQTGRMCVFVDKKYAKGKRNPRWSLIPVNTKRAFHPKLQILIWEKYLRVIIGSANLSRSGYRSNNELVLNFDYYNNAEADKEFLIDCLQYYNDVNNASGSSDDVKNDVKELIKRATKILSQFELEPPEQIPHFIGIKPRGKSVFEQINFFKPSSARYNTAIIESPSFDKPGTKNEAAIEVWNMLEQRKDAVVIYRLSGNIAASDNKIELFAPKELILSKPKRENATIEVKIVDECIEDQIRPLHSKYISFEDDRWLSVVIGSSNFSQSGLGLGNNNFEANTYFLIDKNKYNSTAKIFGQILTNSTDVILDEKIVWQPSKMDTDDQEPSDFCDFIQYIQFDQVNGEGVYKISIVLDAPDFLVIDPSNDQVIFSHKKSTIQEIIFKASKLYPLYDLKICWEDKKCDFPVNILSQDAIPAPDYLSNLTLEEITNLLSSNLPLQKALIYLYKKKQDEKLKSEKIIYDPLKRVDNSSFILQKTRLFSWTVLALRKRIEAPVFSKENLKWRLSGPLGILTIKNVLLKHFTSEEEKAFFLNELISEFSNLSFQLAPGSLSKMEIDSQVVPLLQILKTELNTYAPLVSDNLKKFIKASESRYE